MMLAYAVDQGAIGTAFDGFRSQIIPLEQKVDRKWTKDVVSEALVWNSLCRSGSRWWFEGSQFILNSSLTRLHQKEMLPQDRMLTCEMDTPKNDTRGYRLSMTPSDHVYHTFYHPWQCLLTYVLTVK